MVSEQRTFDDDESFVNFGSSTAAHVVVAG